MMTKTTSPSAKFKTYFVAAAIAAFSFMFADNAYAQTTIKHPNAVASQSTPAEFPGGAAAFRGKVAQNFNSAALGKTKGVLISNALIYINKQGKVTKVVAEGDNEIFNTEVISAIQKSVEGVSFKPATENSVAVSSVLRLPMTLNFE